MSDHLYEPLPDDPRQSPYPWDDEWNDPEWRAFWLNGHTDEELEKMSPRQKGLTLPAYVSRHGYDIYGERALNIIIGARLLDEADISLPSHQDMHFKEVIGNVVRKWLHLHKQPNFRAGPKEVRLRNIEEHGEVVPEIDDL